MQRCRTVDAFISYIYVSVKCIHFRPIFHRVLCTARVIFLLQSNCDGAKEKHVLLNPCMIEQML